MISRRLRRVAVPLVVGVIGLGLAGCSNTVSDAATVTYRDGSGSHTLHITRADFMKQLGQLVGSAEFQTLLKTNNFVLTGDQKNTTGANVSVQYLEQLIGQSAVDAEFNTLHLTITAKERSDAVTVTKEGFALSTEIGQDAQGNRIWLGPGAVYASFPTSFQNSLVDGRAREIALSDYYSTLTAGKEQALYEEFAGKICPSGRVVSQILVKDAATANGILGELRAGASFSDLAKAKSTDTTSAKLGGAVGCVRSGVFVKEFENAALTSPFGVPTGPVKSQFGYHVILVEHASFANLSPELTQALQQNPLVARDLRLQSMQVWVNPQFGSGRLAVDSQQGNLIYQVTPPAVPAPRSQREKSPASTTTTPATTSPAG